MVQVYKCTATDQINIDAQPVYVTASGSLGTVTTNTAGSFSVLMQLIQNQQVM
jgi:hypothetical protein